jgi:hypothetical protein
MERSSDEHGHAAKVDNWLARSVDDGSSAEIVRLFHAAVEAVWNEAVTTLGTTTLAAIADRVLSHAIDRYTFLAAINPRSNGGGRWKGQAHEKLAQVPRAQLIEGLRFGLIELLAVIGTLTAEILCDQLHAALDAVTPIADAQATPHASVTDRAPR